MYSHYNYSNQLKQMSDYMHMQNERINRLEQHVQQLQQELQSVKQNQSSHNIEKVEYKFDQLKVERLEGTLNIGLNPYNGSDSIEDFSVNQKELNTPHVSNQQQPPQLYEPVKQQIDHYLQQDCPQILTTYETKYNYSLEPPYRQFIIDDVKKQIDHRIHFYLNQVNTVNANQDQLNKIEKMTVKKVKEDINKTFDEFLRNLPRKEN
ncbi:spore germination protein GerPC [Anaerobacillus sp. MEB173]|uniref:spore germination protein GerPC n=1 Tax=Anaerobacillus sp. MEB173 TaxID=3383345 RepID=UPI003F92D3C6